MTAKPLIVSNMDKGDVTFEDDLGTWNITRALADCAKGLHKQYQFDVNEIATANANVEVDPVKVAHFKKMRSVLDHPLLFVVENGKLYLIDGHHRIRAMNQIGVKHCIGYVIEEKDLPRYQVLFNGQRKAP